MEFNAKNIKKWSTIGPRPTFGLIMTELARQNEDIMVITADVSTSAGLERYKRMCPNQFLDVGIAEQNMMTIATGLSNEGYKVFTTTFAPFQSMRCLEQIRVYQGYMKQPLIMVGLSSGIYHSYLGNTHCCFEDGAILRAIPNITVVTPADTTELAKLLEASVGYNNSIYIRLIEGKNMPIVYDEDYSFEIGKANILTQGEDIAILANGTMVSRAIEVAKILKEKGIGAKIVDFHTIKPLDEELLDDISANYNYVATMEEHNVIGGLSSAVAEYMMKKDKKPKQIMFGIEDFYPHASSYESALEQCGLVEDKIVKKILNEIGMR